MCKSACGIGLRDFYPRPPRGGRHVDNAPDADYANISIHALREEGDLLRICSISMSFAFLSTPSARRATRAFRVIPELVVNFYPRPPRGGRLWPIRRFQNLRYFYPRPPRGGRLSRIGIDEGTDQFLSTPSARRATVVANDYVNITNDFYPRPPRGGRRNTAYQRAIADIFLSTPSARRATAKTETKSLFSYKLYNILHEFRRALIYNGSKNYPNHAKGLENPVRRCRKDAENSPFAPGRKTQNNSRPSCSKGG